MFTITILCENTVGRIGSGEHGFAAFIETPEGNFLFDTGGGKFIVDNALTFHKNLESLNKVFISHGHDDHTGGLARVLQVCGAVDVHMHPDAFRDRWLENQTKDKTFYTYKGIPFKRPYLESLGGRFVFNREFCSVGKGIYLTGEVPRLTSFETPDPRQKVMNGETYETDTFPDDQSLILHSEKGLTIIFGCAHAGMINIIRHAIKQTGESRIHALIGGTHLGFLGKERLQASLEELRKYSIACVACSHCTGFEGAAALYSMFGKNFQYGCVGFQLDV